MAKTTPEGRIKRQGRDICKKLMPRGLFYFAAQMGGYGKAGIPDDILCVNGFFVSIEYKAEEKRKPTALQIKRMEEIRKAGGITLVVHAGNIYLLEGVLDFLLRVTFEHSRTMASASIQSGPLGFTQNFTME